MDIIKHHMHPLTISRICVIGGSGTDCFKAGFAKCRGKQESPPSFIFSKWKGQKHRKIPYRDMLSVREVDYRKGRC